MKTLSQFIALFGLLILRCRAFNYDDHLSKYSFTNNYDSRHQDAAHEQKVNDIFSLLADIDLEHINHPIQANEEKYNAIQSNIITSNTSIKPNSISSNNNYNNNNNNNNNKLKKTDTSTLKSYFNLLNSVTQMTIGKSEAVENLISTVNKVTDMYDTKKQNIIDTQMEKGQSTTNENGTETEGVLKSTSKVITYLLDPPNIEKVFDISRTAKDEDEILEQLTSLILGAEERSGGGGYGHGLTLDPVTCIALVTLAAYLIRAVFQIVTATAKKRSFDTFDSPWSLSDMPRVMVNVLNMISNSEVEYGRSKRETQNSTESDPRYDLMMMPSELALYLKLSFDGHRQCLRKFICYHLAGRSLPQFGVSQLLWSTIDFYHGNLGLFKYLTKSAQRENANCDTLKSSCNHLPDARCRECSHDDQKHYFQLQTIVNKLVREFSHQYHLEE